MKDARHKAKDAGRFRSEGSWQKSEVRDQTPEVRGIADL
jgi:hypothetical protein